MTKKTENKSAAEKAAAAVDATESKIADRVSEGAREMVKRTTATAKERADDALVTTKKYNATLENMLVRAAKGYTNILGNIADAAFVNVNRGIVTAEKLAEAKSIQEAVNIQTEYVREQSTCSLNNARSAFEYVRDVASENGEALRNTATNMWKSDKSEKAA